MRDIWDEIDSEEIEAEKEKKKDHWKCVLARTQKRMMIVRNTVNNCLERRVSSHSI